MKFSLPQYVVALYQTLHETKEKDHDKVIANFIEVLKHNGDLGHYEKIVNAYEDYDRKQRGVKQVEITTAHDDKLSKSIISELNEIVGKDIELKQKVDESIIGGLVLKVEDTLIDGSIKRQLSNLNDSLTNN